MESKLLNIDVATTETDTGLNIILHETLRRIVREHSDRIDVCWKPLMLSPQMCVFEATATDKKTGRKEIEIGESNPTNLETKIAQQNPAIMAQYRAYDRALIQLLDLPSGKVYSSNEISNYKKKETDLPATGPKQEAATPNNQKTTAQNKEDPAKSSPKLLCEIFGCRLYESKGEIAIYDLTEKTYLKKKDGTIFTYKTEAAAKAALEKREEKRKHDAVATSGIPDDEVLLIGKMAGKKFGEVKNTQEFKEFLQTIKVSAVRYGDKERMTQLTKLKEMVA